MKRNGVCVQFTNVALSLIQNKSSDNGEKPCILTSRFQCLHVYRHSMEPNTFYLPDRHNSHTHLSSATSTSQPLILNSCLFRQCFIGCPFLMKKLVSLYAFYGLQNAAYNNVFNINVQDFCGSMTVCFVFFCCCLFFTLYFSMFQCIKTFKDQDWRFPFLPNPTNPMIYLWFTGTK